MKIMLPKNSIYNNTILSDFKIKIAADKNRALHKKILEVILNEIWFQISGNYKINLKKICFFIVFHTNDYSTLYIIIVLVPILRVGMQFVALCADIPGRNLSVKSSSPNLWIRPKEN